MNISLVAALKQLDVNNNNHWTQDGLPRLETVRILVGDQGVTRDAIVEVAPLFVRSNPVIGVVEPTPDVVLGDTGISTVDQGAPDVILETVPADDLTRVLAELDKELEVATEKFIDAQNFRDAIQKKRDAIIIELKKTEPRSNISESVQAYHARQREIVEKRHEARRALIENGVSLKEISKIVSGAPIDAVRKRR